MEIVMVILQTVFTILSMIWTFLIGNIFGNIALGIMGLAVIFLLINWVRNL